MDETFAESLKLAASAFREGEYSTAYSRYEKLANLGHSESQVFIGWMCFEGKGVPQSSGSAKQWFEIAAKTGHAQGAFYYARLLKIEGNLADAIRWYQTSANTGYAPAKFRLGMHYIHGDGVIQNSKKGFRLLSEASELGNLRAQRELAMREIQGSRGFLFVLIGILKMSWIFFKAIFVASKNKYSESLIG